MIDIRNTAVLATPLAMTATATTVPFDTLIYSTNGMTTFKNNGIQVVCPGTYTTGCTVVLANPGASAVTETLSLMANGTAIPGAIITQTIGAGETSTLKLDWPVKIVSSTGTQVILTWSLAGGAVNLSNAFAVVGKAC